jgi:hypothetical protein
MVMMRRGQRSAREQTQLASRRVRAADDAGTPTRTDRATDRTRGSTEPGPDGRLGPGIEQELRQATERLAACRTAAATSRSSLAEAQRGAPRAASGPTAPSAFQEARDEARHAELAMRQQQRRAADAKLELRRALEWAAFGGHTAEHGARRATRSHLINSLDRTHANPSHSCDGCELGRSSI